jgi:hypothetical protein
MILKRYNQFVNLEPLNENLDKSKKFLKEREIMFKAAKELGFIDDDMKFDLERGNKKTLTLKDFTPEQQIELKKKFRDIRLTDEEIRNLEKNPEFVKLRELFSSNLGYLYNFIYFYFVEMRPFNEIEDMYKQLIEYKDLLGNMKDLPKVGKNFDINFIDPNIPNQKEQRLNAEILADAFEELRSYRQVKKILDTLPPKLKKSYKDANLLLKEEFANIAKAFDELPEDLIDERDKQTGRQLTKKDRIWRNFFGEMRIDTNEFTLDGNPNPRFGQFVFQSRLRRFELDSNPIRSFIEAANTHLKSSMSDFYQTLINRLNETQDRFGKMGINIIFNKNGIIIIEVFTYAANSFLNGRGTGGQGGLGTSHCIANIPSYWPTYLGEYNKQYYLYNTNLLPTKEESIIGVTIQPDRTWDSNACQGVSNQSIGRQFKKILKDWEQEFEIEEDLFEYLQPMSDEEVQKRRRAKIAEREIVRKGITIEQIKQYVQEDGADINSDGAKALRNAVEEDDYEKVKLCLTLGASPNHNDEGKSHSIIASAKSTDVIKLLISYGSGMAASIFQVVIHDIDTLEFCLKAGMDPNFGELLPTRAARTGTYKNSQDIGEPYMDSFKLLIKYGARYEGRNMLRLLRYTTEYARIEMIEYAIEELNLDIPVNYWKDSLRWISSVNRLDQASREKIVNYLESKIKEAEEKSGEG